MQINVTGRAIDTNSMSCTIVATPGSGVIIDVVVVCFYVSRSIFEVERTY